MITIILKWGLNAAWQSYHFLSSTRYPRKHFYTISFFFKPAIFPPPCTLSADNVLPYFTGKTLIIRIPVYSSSITNFSPLHCSCSLSIQTYYSLNLKNSLLSLATFSYCPISLSVSKLNSCRTYLTLSHFPTAISCWKPFSAGFHTTTLPNRFCQSLPTSTLLKTAMNPRLMWPNSSTLEQHNMPSSWKCFSPFHHTFLVMPLVLLSPPERLLLIVLITKFRMPQASAWISPLFYPHSLPWWS